MPTTAPQTDTAEYDNPTVTQLLGHETSWPEHWHTIRAEQGNRALVQAAFAEWAKPAVAA